MAKFDSKSFNPQAFGKYVDRIQRTDKRGIVLVSKAYEVEYFQGRGGTGIYREK